MPCRVVTAGTGAAAMPAFVCDSLAAVPTMGKVTSSFWDDSDKKDPKLESCRHFMIFTQLKKIKK